MLHYLLILPLKEERGGSVAEGRQLHLEWAVQIAAARRDLRSSTPMRLQMIGIPDSALLVSKALLFAGARRKGEGGRKQAKCVSRSCSVAYEP